MSRLFGFVDPALVTVGNILFDIDCAPNIAQIVLQVGPAAAQSLPGAGAFTLEGSNDSVNWVAVPYVTLAGALVTTGIYTVTAQNFLLVATPFRRLRARVSTTITSPPAGQYITPILNEVLKPTINQDQAAPSVTVSGTVTANLAASSGVQLNISGAATGALLHRLPSAAATTNATSVKASSGRLYKIHAFNNSAAKLFLKIYNKASAPVVGTDTPVLTFTLAIGANFFDLGDMGAQLGTGVAYALTGAVADADATALVAGDVIGLNLTYA